jgi:hypothetical protein
VKEKAKGRKQVKEEVLRTCESQKGNRLGRECTERKCIETG